MLTSVFIMSPRLCVLAVSGVLIPGYASAAQATSTEPLAAAVAPRFKATLTASTHQPVARSQWRFFVRVTDLRNRLIRARIDLQVVFRGLSGPPLAELGTYRIFGRWTGTYRWPRAARGEPLAFQAIVTARGATRTLSYWIRVR